MRVVDTYKKLLKHIFLFLKLYWILNAPIPSKYLRPRTHDKGLFKNCVHNSVIFVRTEAERQRIIEERKEVLEYQKKQELLKQQELEVFIYLSVYLSPIAIVCQ